MAKKKKQIGVIGIGIFGKNLIKALMHPFFFIFVVNIFATEFQLKDNGRYKLLKNFKGLSLHLNIDIMENQNLIKMVHKNGKI